MATGAALTATAANTAATKAEYDTAKAAIDAAQEAIRVLELTTANVDTAAEVVKLNYEKSQLAAVEAAIAPTVTTVKTTEDSTDAVNRFRISFSGSGETDGGISYGISGRAEQSDEKTLGSQYISGAFGKISMGDLNGADEVAAGGGVSGVGLTGLGDANDIKYASSDHNIGYEFSTMGLKFAYSQDTTVKTGSNSAMGVSYAGDMGGASVTFGLGQANIGDAKQSTMSASVSSGGLTLKAYTSTNDNGPVKAASETAATATAVYALANHKMDNPDTDQTALSISYSMDAMSVTAFTRQVSTAGTADKDYTGFGFTYDMGGATLKAGVADSDNVQSVDFGVSFSF
jgi:outer membrane protein OmpU